LSQRRDSIYLHRLNKCLYKYKTQNDIITSVIRITSLAVSHTILALIKLVQILACQTTDTISRSILTGVTSAVAMSAKVRFQVEACWTGETLRVERARASFAGGVAGEAE
jgi:hypothetical protein